MLLIWLKKLNLKHLKFFVMQQMKPNVLPSKRKNLNVKVVSSTNAYWLQLKVSLAWQVLQNGVNCCNQQLFIFKISDAAFKEVVEKVLDEHVPDSNDAASFDATRQFTPDEMAELQRRVAESNNAS